MKWHWPLCGFRFFDKSDPDWATKPYVWRICDRRWGHWLLPMPKGRHKGPVVSADVRYGTHIHEQIVQYYRDINTDKEN